MALHAKYKSEYTNANSVKMFVYTINGTKEELAEYETSKGEYLRHCDKTQLPLYITKFSAPDGPFKLSSKGNWFIDNSEQQRKIAHARALGIDVEKIMAEAFLKDVGYSVPSSKPAPEAKVEEEAPFDTDDSDISDL